MMLKENSEKSAADRIRRVGGSGVAVVAWLLVAGLIGCDEKSPAPAAPPPPAPGVSVAHPVQKEVVEWDIYTGHLEAPESVNVAARVSGLVMEVPFIEGSLVKKGDLLAVIDNRSYKADLDSKQADQQKSEAALAIANLTYNRLTGLRKTNAVSQQDVDNAQATLAQAQAALGSSKAAVETSRLNLEWCRVLSPIDGRVSYKLVTAGNLVNGGAGQATILTTVQSVDPMYCYVDIDEQSVLKYQKLAREGKLTSARDGKVPCYIQLENETGFPHEGFIDFVDNHIDTGTGTQRVRGVFKNETGGLMPGFFARLRVPGSGRYEALLVPDTAIGNDQSQRNVLVVDEENKVSARPVELGALFGGLRAIVSGVGMEDRIVVNGQMHVRPGMVVTPTEMPIKVDEAAFSDPGAIAAGRPASTSSTAESASATPAATSQPAGN